MSSGCCPYCKRPWLGRVKIRYWSQPESPRELVTEALHKVLSRTLLSSYLDAARASGVWTSYALQELFYVGWEGYFKSTHFSASLKEDQRLIELLIRNTGSVTMARSCIEAFFDPAGDLAWVTQKNLGFLADASKLTKWVIPAAAKRSASTKPEWRSQEPSVTGVLVDPMKKGRG